jgi:cytochrome c oxidase cbb3-type subunit 2
VLHLVDPRAVVPESVMPGYPFLLDHALEYERIADDLRANRGVGVPYDDLMIESAILDLEAQANPDAGDVEALLARYPGAIVGDFDGNPARITEMDALVAYLQILGRMVDFSTYKAEENYR